MRLDRILHARLLDVAASVAYASAAGLAQLLPRRAAYALAASLGMVRYLTSPALRGVVRANVRRAQVAAPTSMMREATVRAIFRSFACAVVDLLRLPEWTPSAVRAHVRTEGEDVLVAAIARGRGVVIVSAHLGSWEVGGAYLATCGVPVHVVARRHAAAGVQRFFCERRRRLGLQVVDSAAPLRALLNPLRRGECVAMLADRPTAAGGSVVAFCGHSASLPRGPVALALRTGATLLAAVALRDGEGFRIVWRMVPTADLPRTASGIHTGVARAARTLEPWVRTHLHQWHAFEPVWPADERVWAADGAVRPVEDAPVAVGVVCRASGRVFA